MISRFGLFISRVFHKTCPDPFVIAILLTFLTFILALAFGKYPPADNNILDRAEHLLDAWRADDGLWKLLAFGMQMCLILVTGHALASTKPVRAAINALAGWPTSAAGAASRWRSVGRQSAVSGNDVRLNSSRAARSPLMAASITVAGVSRRNTRR